MTLWLLICYGRMRQNMLTFFHRISIVALTCHGRAHHNEYFWFSGFLFLATVSLCSGVQGLRELYLVFPGHLGHLIWMFHPIWSPHLCLWRRRSCGYCAWDFPPPQQGKVDSSLTLFCLNYPGCAGHRKPALNTLLSNITKVYNLLSTIEMSGSWSPD